MERSRGFADILRQDGYGGYYQLCQANGVGVILWSSWRNLVQRGHKKMEEIMKYYGDMGVKGFKVDFFDRDDQRQSIRCMRWQNVPPNIIDARPPWKCDHSACSALILIL